MPVTSQEADACPDDEKRIVGPKADRPLRIDNTQLADFVAICIDKSVNF